MTVMTLDELQTKTTAVFTPRGLIRITGESRLDLLDRMSTNRVKQLGAGQGTATILTSDIGRIIDRLLVYAADDHIWLVTGPNNGENIIRYLMRFVFFNDDFHMANQSADRQVLGVYGGASTAVFTTLALLNSDDDLALHQWQAVQLGDLTATLHRTDPIGGASYFLIVPAAQSTEWQSQLTAAGAQAIDNETYQRLRVQAGLPQLGAEMSLDFIPLETNLWDDVSFNKGCYIGQEIIARMESRGRLAKKLVQFRLPSSAAPTAGSDILADGKAVGMLTSVAGAYALGYVKTAMLTDLPQLTTSDNQPLNITQIFERPEPETT
ncbi:MAG: folate-binding protein YgfZ [Anaerolineales bacterium]|nr:folate-binding protein YgfZ [Anaerolineales bacterium]